MNILFLNPPFIGRFSRTSRSPAVTKGGTFYYPIWLAYAAGIAEKAGHNIRFYDAPAQGISLAEFFELLDPDNFIPDIAVIDTSTPSIYSDVKVAEELKTKWSNIFSVLVGTHPSALPVETLNLSSSLDAVIVGEYDYTILDIADALSDYFLFIKNSFAHESFIQDSFIKDSYLPQKDAVSKKEEFFRDIKGLCFRINERIVSNPARDKIENLDEIPFVSSVYKKYLDVKNYFFAAANYPMIMIMTGRGCPYKCFFCVYPQVFHGRFYRVRSPENVVDEIEYIVKNFPEIKEIGFEDDCFTANKNRVKKICNLIIERNIKIKWYCNVRGNLSLELLKLMKKAGCRLVTVGFESGCQHILDKMNKGEKVASYYEFAENAKKAKILVHGCIMVGNPGDTKLTLKQSYEFVKKLDCDSMQFYPLYVYPGTEAYQWAYRNNYLKTEDYSKWLTKDGLHNCVLDTPALSSEEMVSLCDYYLKKYHFRPKYILKKLLQAVTNPFEGYRSIKSAKIFFSKFLYGRGKNKKTNE